MNFTKIKDEKIIASSWGLHLTEDGKLISCSPDCLDLDILSPYVQVPSGAAKQCQKELEGNGAWTTVERWADHLWMWRANHRKIEDVKNHREFYGAYYWK